MSARIADSHAGATGMITIDLGVLASNWRALAARVAPARCGAVVKADAYGLGAARVIPALARAGCDVFFIATPEEATLARRLAPTSTIYALDGLAGAADHFAHLGVCPVLSTFDELEAWASRAHALGRRLPAAVHIDTGLNRLGLPMRDCRRLAADGQPLSRVDLALVMSHLASADNPRDPKNRDQLVAFETLSALFPGVPRSLAASDGLMLGTDYHFDLVRPGYALYGGQASETILAPVKPVVTVTVRILAVADIAPGETVGYSATWRAKRSSRIATIAAGYADGVPRSASAPDGRPGGQVMIAGALAPIVGRVSMDLVTVDVTDAPAGAVRANDFATLIGPGLSIEDAGYSAGTIGYEILTRLGRRFERVYVGEAS
ncbi:MAG: alanine racemase [Hyphomicrobium sp.]